MKNTGKNLLVLAIILALVPLIILFLVKITPRPPADEIEFARAYLSNAGKDKAAVYSKKLYNEAKVNYDSAMANWRRENERFIFLRDYERVSHFALISAAKAEEATESSIANSSELRKKIKLKIEKLNSRVGSINKLFTSYPLTSEIRNRISQGKFLLKEAELAYNKGQYIQANLKITDSEFHLEGSYENSLLNLKKYFESYSQWEKWVTSTIRESKRNKEYSVIVDKVSRKLYIYKDGSKKHEFDAELGKNWVGDKRVRGDHATPEGMYKVTKKFDSGKTKYYKALLINYPNDEDLRNFKQEVAKGTLPSSAKIGGLIEIHGNGGKGIDWTEGCIALTDKEMDLVYKILKVGTPVTIVGSTVDLQSILNR
jgi:hypothetical protein